MPASVSVPAPIFVSTVPVTVLPAARVTELPFVSIFPPRTPPSAMVRAPVVSAPPACNTAPFVIDTPAPGSPSAALALALTVPPVMTVATV